MLNLSNWNSLVFGFKKATHIIIHIHAVGKCIKLAAMHFNQLLGIFNGLQCSQVAKTAKKAMLCVYQAKAIL